MKKVFILLPIFAAFAYITLSSNAGGNAANYSGVHGAGPGLTGCGVANACHGRGDTRVGVSMWVEDSVGNIIYKYRPGRKYVLQFQATHTTTDNEPKFGFQMSIVTGAGTSYNQAGTFDWASLPAGTGIDSVSHPYIFQQRSSLSPSVGIGGFGSIYKTRVTWIAPPLGTGKVSIFGIACVVDNNNLADTLADKWNNSRTYIDEEDYVAVGALSANTTVTTWPNPVAGQLHIEVGSVTSGYYSLQVYSLNGVNVANMHVTASELNGAVINTSAWQSGMYYLVIKGEGAEKVVPVVKQ